MSSVYSLPSNHSSLPASKPGSFQQFRAYYTLPNLPNGAFRGLPLGSGGQHSQAENEVYDYYLSAAHNPLVTQQVNTAASRLFEEALNQMIPSWTELLRMGIRSAQEQWASRRPSIFGEKTKSKAKTLSLKHDEWPRRFYRWI